MFFLGGWGGLGGVKGGGEGCEGVHWQLPKKKSEADSTEELERTCPI